MMITTETETDLYPEEVDDTRPVELDEGETNPGKIREAVLELLEELEASGNEGEEDCHHLPWRGRCWRGDIIHIPWKASQRSIEDTRRYRANYPDIPKGRFIPYLHDNSDFYTMRRRAYPCGEYIDMIHSTWWGKYRKLETQKDYIEWLFPTREIGTNWHAQDLTRREIKTITKDWRAHNRVLTSYEMMLDFYGMRLRDHEFGTVERSPGWRERFRCLNQSNSSHRHITRILKCLGELNHEHLKAPFVDFVLHEAITEGTLPNTLDSCMEYWVEVVRSAPLRKQLKRKARQLAREHNRRVLVARGEEEEDEDELEEAELEEEEASS